MKQIDEDMVYLKVTHAPATNRGEQGQGIKVRQGETRKESGDQKQTLHSRVAASSWQGHVQCRMFVKEGSPDPTLRVATYYVSPQIQINFMQFVFGE